MSPVSPRAQHTHVRRKGGGGGHGGGSHGDDGGEGHGSEASRKETSKEKNVPVSGATDGARDAVAYGPGGGKAKILPDGEPFAGRKSGGGVRSEVYGTSEYGSGYPGLPAGSVEGRGFPFVFWPIDWPRNGYGAPYLYDHEYGPPTNSSRPGGPLAYAAFAAPQANSTFFVVSDTSTVSSLLTSLPKACTLNADASSEVPKPFTGNTSGPLPEQVVQYYRASSVALLLDGYNNTDALLPQVLEGEAVPLPAWADRSLLECLNTTIGEAIPLFSDKRSNTYVWAVVGAGGGFVVVLLLLWGCKTGRTARVRYYEERGERCQPGR